MRMCMCMWIPRQIHPGGHEIGGPDVLRGIAGFVREIIEASAKA